MPEVPKDFRNKEDLGNFFLKQNKTYKINKMRLARKYFMPQSPLLQNQAQSCWLLQKYILLSIFYIFFHHRSRRHRPLTLSNDLVIFITHPSQIIFQARRAVFRESSNPWGNQWKIKSQPRVDTILHGFEA